MTFIQIYFEAFVVIMTMMTILWIVSIIKKNVSIVDMFWGFGFVLAALFYLFMNNDFSFSKILIVILVTIWGLRLSIYLGWRNHGKGEDFRYKEFRKKYGENRYWWISFFQTFLLQGILMWIISMPLLGGIYNHEESGIKIFQYIGIIFWIIGIIFEAGGDFQLAKFKSNPQNKGKVLNTGLWKYTRHPNYFGDVSIWWGFGFFSIANESYIPVVGSIIMTLLIIKVSGVALLEKSLKNNKPEYAEYIAKTSSFIPWFPKKINK